MKGMRSSLAGFVFSVYAFVMMVSSPFLGKILPSVGAKFMLLGGIWLAGWCNVLFGVLEYVNDPTMFTVLCFVVRAVGAFGAASFSTASYTYVIHLFPDNVGLAFGLTETCVGVGMSLGPAVGGLLYGIGGYGLPFYVLGSFVLATGPLCYLFVDHIDSEFVNSLLTPLCVGMKELIHHLPDFLQQQLSLTRKIPLPVPLQPSYYRMLPSYHRMLPKQRTSM